MLRKLEQLDARVKLTRLSDGLRSWDYLELCAGVSAWQQHFEARQVQVVAFEVNNGLEWVAISLALLESNRVAVPVPSFFSAQQKQHAIADSGAQLFVGSLECETLAPGQRLQPQEVHGLVSYTLVTKDVMLPESTALVTYTSGSTGEPRGVCLSVAHLLGTAQAIVERVGSLGIQRHLCALPLTLLLENVAGFYANLLNGSEILVPGLESLGLRGSSGLDLQLFVAGLQTHQPESLILVPAQLLGLVTAAEWGLELPTSLKFVAVGGGKVAVSLLERAVKIGIPVFEGYGLTECGSVVTLNSPGESCVGSVGRLLSHVRTQIVDGQLIIEHPCMLGYVDTTSIGPVPREPIATGDLVSRDTQGFLHIQGRSKNTFITAFGRNLSPEWVESELQSELAIAHAVVFGEGANQPVALLVLRNGFGESDIATAILQVNARLPDYAQIADWALLTAAELADCQGLTSNGRVRRQAVFNAYQQTLQNLVQQHAQESLHA